MHKKAKSTFFSRGGNIGDRYTYEEYARYDMMDDFPENSVLVFPQTIHFENEDIKAIEKSKKYYSGREGLTLVAREKKSYQTMKSFYPDTKVLISPDIVLSTTKEDYGLINGNRNKILWVMRHDVERCLSENDKNKLLLKVKEMQVPIVETDMISKEEITQWNRMDRVKEKMQEFRDAKLVVTDRLHGMVFAAIAETPCIVLSNYNHKVKGTYEWISYLPYIKYVESVEEAIDLIPQLLAMKDCHFDNSPLMPYFEDLRKEVLRLCQLN